MDATSKIKTEITISMGHKLEEYIGECAYIHGHNWRVEVEVEGTIDNNGFVVDFKKIKEIINIYDHRTILKDTQENARAFGGLLKYGFVFVKFNPTAENLARYYSRKIYRLGNNIEFVRVKVWESNKSYAKASHLQIKT